MVDMFQFAHAGGVRRGNAPECIYPDVFQFAHAGGVRLSGSKYVYVSLLFQFAHAGGVRRPPTRRDGCGWSFNSRTRGACDGLCTYKQSIWLKSFNSRTRGACDASNPTKSAENSVFQFAHAGGVRRSTS